MLQFSEKSRCLVAPSRYVVISRRSDGRVSVAQQIETKVENNTINFYMKNAIITDVEGLRAMKEAVCKALDILTAEEVAKNYKNV